MPPRLSTASTIPNPPPPSIVFDGNSYFLASTFYGGISPVGLYTPPKGTPLKDIAVKYFNTSIPTLPTVARDAFAVWNEVREPLLRAGFPDYFACNPDHQVTEYAHGVDVGTLADYNDGLHISEIRSLLLSVIPHIGAMMESGVVHADIKPANIIVDVKALRTSSDWKTKIIDPDTMRRTGFTSNRLFGTPYFMPPEVARGGNNRTTDVFSLAMTAINLLSSPRYVDSLDNQSLYGVARKNPKATLIARAFDYVFVANARAQMESALVPLAADCRHELKQVLDFIFRGGDPDPDARPRSGLELSQILTTKPNRIEI